MKLGIGVASLLGFKEMLRLAALRRCEACGEMYNPHEVPCACIYCPKCWGLVARHLDLPRAVRCRLGKLCPAHTDSKRIRAILLEMLPMIEKLSKGGDAVRVEVQ